MTANYVLLEKITVGAAGAASVTFSGIPQTGYTDLVLKASVRNTDTGGSIMRLQFNGDTAANYSVKALTVNGATAASYNAASQSYVTYMAANCVSETANTFGNAEIYIPNYTSSNQKSISVDSISENNATTAYVFMDAGLWTGTSAITSITLLNPGSTAFTQYSTFYLYGVAALGTTPAIVPYATGGDTIMTDGTYWYHAFKASGTFTPAKGLSCDVLVVAGGGSSGGPNSGGSLGSGGGGAGGVYYSAANSLTATGYTVTVGGGGASVGNNANGTKGTNSTFGSLTDAVGGGYGATYSGVGGNGGSGGGASGTPTASSGTAGQGNNGGAGDNGGVGAGGGGAGAVGANGPGTNGGGNGGAGTNTYSTWHSATGTGVSGYIAGGGGGSAYGGYGTGGTGGSGGGGNGRGSNYATAIAGTVNTGSGGGGQQDAGVASAAGGSGLIIVRYPA